MAQLPPKVPSMTPNWPAFPHQRMPPIAHHPSWVDEFLDFSSSRRGSHRRSVSDSITFLEPTSSNITAMMMHGNDKNDDNNDSNGFDRLDDEQLMSMFSDDMTAVMVASNPSTPSDQHSNNDEKSNVHDQQHQNQYHHHVPKHEPGEVESSCMSDLQPPPPSTTTGDTFMDPKRVKRILANRQSAQRSRVRKLQYISELERSVTSLQSEVSALSPRVAFLDHQRLILNVDNSTLKQRIAALAQDKIFKDAHQEALQKEIERLRQVYHQQSLKNNTTNAPEREAAHQTPNSDDIDCADETRMNLSTEDAEEVHYSYCEDERKSVDL